MSIRAASGQGLLDSPTKNKAAKQLLKAPDQANVQDPTQRPKGSKKKLILIIIIVAVLLIGGGDFYLKSKAKSITYRQGEAVPLGKLVPLTTSLTVNTADGDVVEVGISLQLTVVANPKTILADHPLLLNATIADIDKWSYTSLLTSVGRAGLQSDLLESYQGILGEVHGAAEQVSAVYFTTFVQQQ